MSLADDYQLALDQFRVDQWLKLTGGFPVAAPSFIVASAERLQAHELSLSRLGKEIPITQELLAEEEEIADNFADHRDAIVAASLGLPPPVSRRVRREIVKRAPELLALLEELG